MEDSPAPSSDAGSSSAKPKQPSRSVSQLTPEQLAWKRAQDRESQRLTRLRVKQTIAGLEGKVEELTKQLIAIKLENDSLKAVNQLPPIGSIPQHMPLDAIPILPVEHYPGVDVIIQQRNLRANQFVFDPSQFAQLPDVYPPMAMELPDGLGILDPTLLQNYSFDTYVPPPSLPVWQARPCHYPATCRQDKIILGIIEARKQFSQTRGKDTELSDTEFPAVAPLLNPHNHATRYPLTTKIVSEIIYCFTIESLPLQIAMMYIMTMMTRWYITGSKEDYDALPEWLRPSAAQLVTAHPVWVDFFPWPASRDRLCQDLNAHNKFDAFANAGNSGASVNWPYNPADCLITLPSKEVTLNPVFISHIRKMSNWTYSPSFFQQFPEFEHDLSVMTSKPWSL